MKKNKVLTHFSVRFSVAFILLISGFACQTLRGPASQAGPKSEEKKNNLLLSEAEIRRRQISQVDYVMDFQLEAHELEPEKSPVPYFTAEVKVIFKLQPDAAQASDEIFLDFSSAKILSMEVNQQAWDDIDYDGRRIVLPLKKLHAASTDKENQVLIRYQRAYSPMSSGLYRFVDPEDQKVYVYSDLEPFYANKIFPAFDQPDLKATYQVSVTTPKDWTVIANSSQVSSRTIYPGQGQKGPQRRNFKFKKTKKFSTYLWALHAGPWHQWSSHTGHASKIPMRLFARKSLAKFVDADEWFKITRGGMQYFEEAFASPYAFEKYDQVLVPDFNWGGMENVAAVTYNDMRYVFRSRPTAMQEQSRAAVILHELAHMWFGNLVTMKWWNDLWLNESFATFAATLALNHLQEQDAKKFNFLNAWSHFNVTSKRSASYADQLSTSHPIEVFVRDTDDTLSLFDAISYGKGAASLKQLYYFVEGKNFLKGLQNYFKKHAYDNATINDLVTAISQAAQVPLQDWKQLWLQHAGINTVTADWKCIKEKGSSRVSYFRVKQGGPNPNDLSTDQALRPHRSEVALYRVLGGKLRMQNRFSVHFSKAETPVTEAYGMACPDLVISNYGDWDYARMDFNDSALRVLEKYLHSLHGKDEELVRLMIWESLFQKVIDGSLRSERFIDMALRSLSREDSTLVTERLQDALFQPLAHQQSALRLLPHEQRPPLREKVEEMALLRFKKAKTGSHEELQWLDYYLKVSTSEKASQQIHQWLGQKKINGVNLDQSKRWDLVVTLSRLNHPAAQELVVTESKKDKSHFAQIRALQADASLPMPEKKKYWLKQVYREGKEKDLLPAAQTLAALCCINPLGQEELLKANDEQYFSNLSDLAEEEDPLYVRNVAQRMRPAHCDPDYTSRSGKLAKKYAERGRTLYQSFMEVGQENERCLKARQSIDPPQP